MKFLKRITQERRKSKARKKIAEYENLHRSEEPRERPEVLHVEETFDAFVVEFGGEKISDRLHLKAQMPLNADYIFPEYNVIAELKTLEGIFSGDTAVESLRQVFIDVALPDEIIRDIVFRNRPMPDKANALIRTRIRRGLEQRIKKARKQLRLSKSMFGNPQTFSLVLVAMDQPPLFGHQLMLTQLAILMGSNFADEHIDGVVYFNPNTPTRFNPDGMEFSGWYPFYRDDDVNAKLSAFVNLLGNRWLNYCGERWGEGNPILELETFDEMMVALGSSR
ncbi:hypothetical protein [Agrobacterium radiobacter]|uniref:hypothetical protein n=1 Tax=Agrobacterium radiobacter TaxID=362 RepID=UPI0007622207|nr:MULTISPECIES: hypothetical protein [Agrobacterium tumefaciens complex]KAB0459778.1 hypothetical protein F7R04_12775 [Agrobacterium tumefaciens]KWT77086.1 hypothetical protein ASH09_12155 [Agrobacterium radiobacter]NIB11118.1 hypothetical protein [Agrobacterium radiobacter]OOO38260.1 hypothetical protein BS628_08895 [Agrobacterium radiobacter]